MYNLFQNIIKSGKRRQVKTACRTKILSPNQYVNRTTDQNIFSALIFLVTQRFTYTRWFQGISFISIPFLLCVSRGGSKRVLTCSGSLEQWKAPAWQSWGSSCCPDFSCQSSQGQTAAAGWSPTPGSPPTPPRAGSQQSPALSLSAQSDIRQKIKGVRERKMGATRAGQLMWLQCQLQLWIPMIIKSR